MANFNVTLDLSTTTGTTEQNVTAGDTVTATIDTNTTTGWTAGTLLNCTLSASSGSDEGTVVITPSTSGSYQANFSSTYYSGKTPITHYGYVFGEVTLTGSGGTGSGVYENLDTITVTVGNGISSTTYGYWDEPPIGADFGSISGSTKFFDSAAIKTLACDGNNKVYLRLMGNYWPNEGWDRLEINGTGFTRSSAEWSTQINVDTGDTDYDNANNNLTQWKWSAGSNPFGTTVGATKTVYIQQEGFVNLDDQPITLNEIHQEAAASSSVSGTSVTMNDQDVRELNWYGQQYGSTPSSGGTTSMVQYYHPRFAKHDWTYRPYRSGQSSDVDGTAADEHYAALVTRTATTYAAAPNPASATANAWWDIVVRHDGSKTYLEVTAEQPGSRTLYYKDGSSTTVTRSGSAVWEEVLELDEAFDLVSMFTQTLDSSTSSSISHSGNFNETASYDVNPARAPETSGVTHLSTNSTTSYTNMSSGTRYGRNVRAQATAGVDAEDTDLGFLVTATATAKAIFRARFQLVKYPASGATLRIHVVEIAVMGNATAQAQTD